MALYCTRHYSGPLDVWYDCTDCCRGDKEEALMYIRRMICPDYQRIRTCDWCGSHCCWNGENQCSQPAFKPPHAIYFNIQRGQQNYQPLENSRTMNVMAEFGPAEQKHLDEAKQIFHDIIESGDVNHINVNKGLRLERQSPAAGQLLWKWMHDYFIADAQSSSDSAISRSSNRARNILDSSCS